MSGDAEFHRQTNLPELNYERMQIPCQSHDAITFAATARVIVCQRINFNRAYTLASRQSAKAHRRAHESVLHARNAENALTSDTVQAFPMASHSFARSGKRTANVYDEYRVDADYQVRPAPPTGPASNISRRKVRANSLAAIPSNPIRGNDLTPRVTRDIVRSRRCCPKPNGADRDR